MVAGLGWDDTLGQFIPNWVGNGIDSPHAPAARKRHRCHARDSGFPGSILVAVRCLVTPKEFANSSPEFPTLRSESNRVNSTLTVLANKTRDLLQSCRGFAESLLSPGVGNPRLELANAFGVKSQADFCKSLSRHQNESLASQQTGTSQQQSPHNR